jgi:hypothetical protein
LWVFDFWLIGASNQALHGQIHDSYPWFFIFMIYWLLSHLRCCWWCHDDRTHLLLVAISSCCSLFF